MSAPHESAPDKPAPHPSTPLQAAAAVRALAREIRRAGSFALDLEFVSESRYIPELALVQVAWGDAEAPEVAAIDPLAADPRPLFELVAAAEVETVLHAGQGDLALLAGRFGVQGRRVVDAQIAAAFLGLGEQIGYTALVESVVGVSLSKASQFTDWLRRPLSDEQLRYALDDVRYLPRAWRQLSRRLDEQGRLGWVEEESARLARQAGGRTPPEEMYRRVSGWNRLSRRQLGALRAAAAWREREALASNTPPSWLVHDRSLLELARKPPADEHGLSRVRGVKPRTAREHGAAILEALRQGAAEAPELEPRPKPLPEAGQTWVSLVGGLIKARCRQAGIAPRFVAARDDAERLVRWWLEGDRSREPALPLLAGWRRELAGETALAWLAGETALAADPEAESGLRLVEGLRRGAVEEGP